MVIFILAITVIAVLVGLVLPIDKANLRDLPRCPKPDNTDLEYSKTVRFTKEIPYCDEDETEGQI